jgi:hypothetical protein
VAAACRCEIPIAEAVGQNSKFGYSYPTSEQSVSRRLPGTNGTWQDPAFSFSGTKFAPSISTESDFGQARSAGFAKNKSREPHSAETSITNNTETVRSEAIRD